MPKVSKMKIPFHHSSSGGLDDCCGIDSVQTAAHCIQMTSIGLSLQKEFSELTQIPGSMAVEKFEKTLDLDHATLKRCYAMQIFKITNEFHHEQLQQMQDLIKALVADNPALKELVKNVLDR